MQKWKPKPEELKQLAFEYIENCLAGTKEMATNKGVVKIKDRHIPTVGYFLNIWIPIVCKKDTICRTTYYKWLHMKGETSDIIAKTNTIKTIDEAFKELATDIVANEGKGIFYAKNRLGMTDKQMMDVKANVNILSIDPLADNGKD